MNRKRASEGEVVLVILTTLDSLVSCERLLIMFLKMMFGIDFCDVEMKSRVLSRVFS